MEYRDRRGKKTRRTKAGKKAQVRKQTEMTEEKLRRRTTKNKPVGPNAGPNEFKNSPKIRQATKRRDHTHTAIRGNGRQGLERDRRSIQRTTESESKC